jgi:F-type H+-transporting ATPase subunit b
VVNFSIVLGLLYLFAYKPVLKFLDQRSENIKESLDAAENARYEAKQSEERTRVGLQDARREGEKFLEQARENARIYQEEEMSRARQEADNFMSRAREEIKQERDGAIDEVRRHFAGLTIRAAEQVIGRSIDNEIHRELIEKVLDQDHSTEGKGQD